MAPQAPAPGLPSRTDVAVVGAGTAGAIVAHRLAAAGDRSVLLLEQGPAAAAPVRTSSLARLPIDDPVRAEHFAEVRGRPVVRGRGLGGSAGINGGYFLRPHPADLGSWPSWWTADRVGLGYAALDGGAAGGGRMSVHAFGDDELGDVARAFEDYWSQTLGPADSAPWPHPGLLRVRSNRRDGHRFTAADGFLSPPPAGLTVVPNAAVDEILLGPDAVTGVRVGGQRVAAGEVIVAAGTLGTARLLRRSGLWRRMGVQTMYPREHPERLVRFTARREIAAPALLQTVMHTPDGLEIRCYGDDFAQFVDEIAPRGVPIGVADLAHPTAGSLDGRPDDPALDLGAPDADSIARMDAAADAVVRMLSAPEFAELVVPGSIEVDPVLGMSQHAAGTLPLGAAVDHLGAVPEVGGLRVVDGSVLPGPLRAGPHATIAMVAWVIGGELARQGR